MAKGIGDALRAQEQILRAFLDYSRATYEHMGDRGTSVEGAFRDFLGKHLARYLTVGNGEVIDTYGTRSGQVDVVISNVDQMFGSPVNEPGLFLVEGVSAAGEVKTKLTTRQLELAIGAGDKFKNLQSLSQVNDVAISRPADMARFFDCPPFFVFAMESEVAVSTLLSSLHEATLAKPRQPKLAVVNEPTSVVVPPVDAVFVLGQGAAIYYSKGAGLKVRDPGGEEVVGWVFDYCVDGVLSSFLLWLNACMPRIRRAAPISIPYFMSRTTRFDTIDSIVGGDRN